MIKNCKVLINNEAISVIDYDGVQVQIPSIHKEAKTVNVVVENGRYIVVDDNYIEPVVKSTTKPKKKAAKKTTLEYENAEYVKDVECEHLTDSE